MIWTERYWRFIPAVCALAIAAGGCGPTAGIGPVDPAKAFIDARSTLRQAAESTDPVTRSNAIEALSEVVGTEAGGVYLEALSDRLPVVRFAGAMAVAETQYAPAEATLVRRAKETEPDSAVMCAVTYALHRLGNDEYTWVLGKLLFDDDAETRANAAMVMGLMGEPSAQGPLKALLADEQQEAVRLQARAALARLGDSESKVRLRAYVKGYFLDLRLAAIPAMADINPPGAAGDFRMLLDRQKAPRVRVAAAGALARVADVDPAGYALCVRAMRDPRSVLREGWGEREIRDLEVESLQALAALSLGRMGRYDAIPVLREHLESPVGAVRVAAALSILRIGDTEAMPTKPAPEETPEKAPEPPSAEPEPELPALGPAETSPDTEGGPAPEAPPVRPKIHTSGPKD